MESVEQGIKDLDKHTEESVKELKNIFAKSFYDAAKKSVYSSDSIDNKFEKVFNDDILIDKNEIFNPETVVEFDNGKSTKMLETWDKTKGLLPNRVEVGDYYIDKKNFYLFLYDNDIISIKKCNNSHLSRDNNLQFKNCDSFFEKGEFCDHITNMDSYVQFHRRTNKNFGSGNMNYDYCSRSNPKAISKFNGTQLSNVSRLPHQYIWEDKIKNIFFDKCEKFKIDNYLNLYHEETGLYLMFNKTSFPLTCFYLAKKYTRINEQEYYKIFYPKIISEDMLFLNKENYKSVDNREKFLEDIDKIVPTEYKNVYEFYSKFRDLQNFDQDYQKLEELKLLTPLNIDEKINEGLKIRLNEYIKKCEILAKTISDMSDEYNHKSIALQDCERNKNLKHREVEELKLKHSEEIVKLKHSEEIVKLKHSEEMEELKLKHSEEMEELKLKHSEEMVNIKEESDRKYFKSFKQLGEANCFKQKADDLEISYSSLKEKCDSLNLKNLSQKDVISLLTTQIMDEKKRANDLVIDNEQIFNQLTIYKKNNSDIVAENEELKSKLSMKDDKCLELTNKLEIIGNKSSSVLENALSDQIKDLKEEIEVLKKTNQEILKEKETKDREIKRIKNTVSELLK